MADAASAYSIGVVVTADTEGLETGASQAAEAIENLASVAEGAGETVDSSMSTASESVTGIGEAAAETGKAVEDGLTDATKSVEDLATTTDTAAGDIETAAGSIADNIGKVPTATDAAATAVTDNVTDMTTSLEDLSNAAQDTATEVDAALATSIPASANAGVVGLSTKAGKFKAVGSQLGTQLSNAIGDGIKAPDAIASMGTSLSGLLAITSKSAKGLAAAVGLGIGVTVIKSLIDAMNARQDAVDAAIKEILDSMEVNAKTTMKEIHQTIMDGFDIKDVLTKAGGDDLGAGIDRVKTLAEGIAVAGADSKQNFGELTELLRGKALPAYVDTLQAVREQARETDETGTILTTNAVHAKEYLEMVHDARIEQEAANGQLRTVAGLYDNATGAARGLTGEQKANAYWSNVAADATERQQAAMANINNRSGNGSDVS